MPLRFAASPIVESLRNQGRLPSTPESILATINARLPEGATPLTEADIYVLYPEAASDRYIPDRSMYMGPKTLRNIAREAAEGVAFMNSHRTGDMSAPAELPYGRTFAGQSQKESDETGIERLRAVLGVYLLRGIYPNGQGGPSTDDLFRMMNGGILQDVSVGLYGGERLCSVCGEDLYAMDEEYDYLCSHVPGTTWDMTPEEIAAEKERDATNTNGYAAYILEDAHFSEVSGVYDGAVPGAGVKKVMALARSANFSNGQVENLLRQVAPRYGAFLPDKLNQKFAAAQQSKPAKGASMSTLDNLLVGLGWKPPAEAAEPKFEPGDGKPKAAVAALPAPAEDSAELAQLRAELAEERRKGAAAKAQAFAAKHQGRYLPANRTDFVAAAAALHAKAQTGEATAADVEAVFDIPTATSVSNVFGGAMQEADLVGATVYAGNAGGPKPQDVEQTAQSIVDARNGVYKPEPKEAK